MDLFKKENSIGGYDYIVAGLGNPGKQYENSRHNTGFITIDVLAEKYGAKINKLKYKALLGDCTIDGKKVLLLKPQTFMNNSGESVRDAMTFYKIPPERVIVMFDDISLDVGKMRIRLKGSDGGQKGIRSIIELTGKDSYPRIKVGIGAKPNPNWELADWVLSKFTKSEKESILDVAEKACKAVELLVNDKAYEAMNLYNS